MGLWIHQYRPKSLKDIPQTESAVQLEKFVKSFSTQKKKGVLLYGPSGTCKSSAVHALAQDLGWELIEVNASDVRNEEQILQKVGNAVKQHSLFFSGKIILVPFTQCSKAFLRYFSSLTHDLHVIQC